VWSTVLRLIENSIGKKKIYEKEIWNWKVTDTNAAIGHTKRMTRRPTYLNDYVSK